MSKLGRPPSTVKRKETTICLQPRYINTLERLCHDPFFQKRKMGKRNEIIELALDRLLESQGIEIRE